jgi:hypothetical protein
MGRRPDPSCAKTCVACGTVFKPPRRSAQYCSNRCKTAYGKWSWPVQQGVEKVWGEAS